MNVTRYLNAFWRPVNRKLNDVRMSRFFRDRLSTSLLIGTLVLNGLNLVSLVLSLRPTPTQVPVRYSSLTLFDALGPWYYPFLIVLFALAVSVVNGYFAYHSFGRSRIASFYLLAGAGVVGIFSFIISLAFGVVR